MESVEKSEQTASSLTSAGYFSPYPSSCVRLVDLAECIEHLFFRGWLKNGTDCKIIGLRIVRCSNASGRFLKIERRSPHLYIGAD